MFNLICKSLALFCVRRVRATHWNDAGLFASSVCHSNRSLIRLCCTKRHINNECDFNASGRWRFVDNKRFYETHSKIQPNENMCIENMWMNLFRCQRMQTLKHVRCMRRKYTHAHIQSYAFMITDANWWTQLSTAQPDSNVYE